MRIFLVLVSFILFSCISEAQVIYGVSPYYFSRGQEGSFYKNLTERLPELKKLGIDILWLQPVFKSATEGQAYDVTDYFSLNPAYGSDQELRKLISAAHLAGMRVIFDLPLNHTADSHPYVLDVSSGGKNSRYYDFYQHGIQGDSLYNSFLNSREIGGTVYYHYFWKDLLNLNYSNPEVQKLAVDIVAYWIKEYDIDGYRFDAGWAPASRWPRFYQEINQTIRELKPEAFLVAEDASNNPLLANSGFNFAYDWGTEDPEWLSKWIFQTGDTEHETVFNLENATDAARAFHDALKGNLERATISSVRYIENNDTGSFLQTHSLEQTKFAAAIQFILPGTPLLFYGQAEGISYPQWHLPAFDPQKKMSSYHPELWSFYSHWISLRREIGVIRGLKNLKRQRSLVDFELLPSGHSVRLDFKAKKIWLNSRLVSDGL